LRPYASDSALTTGTAIRLPVRQARTCIIVAGMHRSGTSATARVVNLLGADIASDLLPGIPGNNDRGFWESATTYQLHDRLLHGLESAWDDPYPLVDGWPETHGAREAKRAIVAHIEKEFGASTMFVVKDPRVSRLLPVWLQAFDELSIAPIVVIPFRNPIAVAASLERRDGLPFAKSLLAYIQGNLEVERASRGVRRVFQLYDDLISDWRPFAAKLAGAGGQNANAISAGTAAAIDGFLSTDLRHHRATREDLARLPEAAPTLVEMYDGMVEAAATGAETALRACFDRARERLWETAKLFRTVALAQAKDYREELAGLSAKTTAEFERRDAELEALRSQFAEREVRLNELAGHVDERSARLEELASHLAQRDAGLEQLAAQLGQRDARLEELAAQLGRSDARLAELTVELRRRTNQMNEMRAHLAALEAKLAETVRRNVLANEEIASLRRSTSWRVTAPLRAVGRLGRALQRRSSSFTTG